MKKFLLTLLLFIPLTLSAGELRQVVFDSNVHCDNCAKKIVENISFEKGVKDLSVSLAHKTITIIFDDQKITEETLAKKIKELGYTATVKESKVLKK